MSRYVAYIILAIVSIEAGQSMGGNVSSMLLFACIGSLGLIVVVWRRSKVREYLVLAILATTLFARAFQALPPNSFNPQQYSGQDLRLQAIVSEDPRVGQKSTQITLDNIRLTNQVDAEWHGKVTANIPTYLHIEYGDMVEVAGKFKDLSQINDVGFRDYLYHHSIHGQIDWPSVKVLDSNKGNQLVSYGLKTQHAANQEINRLMPLDAASFLTGVVLGSRQPVSEEFDDALKATGTSHLIVASGYNISILIATMIKITKFMRKNETAILVITMIACYTFISGLDPSIIRASIMAGLGLLATLFGKQKHAIYLMVLAGLIMLLINPLWIYDVGFQLSFAATFGIITLQSSIFNKLVYLPGFLREALSTSMAAQVFVYPILITTFGQISIISLLSNLLVIWVIPLIMFGGVIVMLLAFISQPLARISSMLIYPLLWYIKTCVTLTSNLPYATITVSNVNWTVASIYYAIIYYIYRLRGAYEANLSS